MELRDFGGWKGVALLCWTGVLNWGGGDGTEGDPLNDEKTQLSTASDFYFISSSQYRYLILITEIYEMAILIVFYFLISAVKFTRKIWKFFKSRIRNNDIFSTFFNSKAGGVIYCRFYLFVKRKFRMFHICSSDENYESKNEGESFWIASFSSGDVVFLVGTKPIFLSISIVMKSLEYYLKNWL